MERSQIQEILHANVGRRVRVRWDDGDDETITVLTVDSEGFAYELVPPDPKQSFGTGSRNLSRSRPNRLMTRNCVTRRECRY